MKKPPQKSATRGPGRPAIPPELRKEPRCRLCLGETEWQELLKQAAETGVDVSTLVRTYVLRGMARARSSGAKSA